MCIRDRFICDSHIPHAIPSIFKIIFTILSPPFYLLIVSASAQVSFAVPPAVQLFITLKPISFGFSNMRLMTVYEISKIPIVCQPFLKSYISNGNSKPLNRPSFCKHRAIKLCTFFVFLKCLLRLINISVNLPTADTFAAPGFVIYKAENILRRIAEEQSDFMGKLLIFAEVLDQPDNTALRFSRFISAFLQQTTGVVVLEIPTKLRGTVNLY